MATQLQGWSLLVSCRNFKWVFRWVGLHILQSDVPPVECNISLRAQGLRCTPRNSWMKDYILFCHRGMAYCHHCAPPTVTMVLLLITDAWGMQNQPRSSSLFISSSPRIHDYVVVLQFYFEYHIVLHENDGVPHHSQHKTLSTGYPPIYLQNLMVDVYYLEINRSSPRTTSDRTLCCWKLSEHETQINWNMNS